MSANVIDEKIVKLSLDNGEFDSAIDKSIKSINKLEERLTLKDAGDGFNDLSRSAKRVDLSPITDALDEVIHKIKLLDLIYASTLINIANKASRTGIKIAKSLTIQPALDGLNEYNLKLSSIQTILANTRKQGTKLKDVTETLDELNHYADKTVYVFSDMTRAISQFTTAGVSLKQATTAIKGMSNLAAAVGADNATLSRVNYQVSQALNTGVFRLVDWRSLEYSSGIGGATLQDALRETAKEFGKDVDSMIAKHGSFRESLQEGWLTADIYLKTMEKFSDPKNYPQYAYMEEAATKVRSFKKLVETTIESIGSRWASVFETIIGDFDEATALWSSVNDALNGDNSPLSKLMDGIQSVITAWDELGGRKELIEALARVFDGLWSHIKPVVMAFESFHMVTGAGLKNATSALLEFSKKLRATEDTAYNIYSLSKWFAIFTETAFKIHFKLLDALTPLLDLLSFALEKITGLTGDLGEQADQAYPIIMSLVDILTGLIKMGLDKAVKFLIDMWSQADMESFKEALSYIVPLLGTIFTVFGKIAKAVMPFVNKLVQLIPKIIPYLITIINVIGMVFEAIWVGAQKIAEFFGDGLIEGLIDIIAAIVMVATEIANALLDTIKDILGIHSPSKAGKELMENFGAGMEEGGEDAEDTSKSLGEKIATSFSDALSSRFGGLIRGIGDIISAAFRGLGSILRGILSAIYDFFFTIGDFFAYCAENAGDLIRKAFELIRNLIVWGAKAVWEGIKFIWDQITSLIKQLSEELDIPWDKVFCYAVIAGLIIGFIGLLKLIFGVVKAINTIGSAMSFLSGNVVAKNVLSPLSSFILALALVITSFIVAIEEIKHSSPGQIAGAVTITLLLLAAIMTCLIIYKKTFTQEVVIIKRNEKAKEKLRVSLAGFLYTITICMAFVMMVANVLKNSENPRTITVGIVAIMMSIVVMVGVLGLVMEKLKGEALESKKLEESSRKAIYESMQTLLIGFGLLILSVVASLKILDTVDSTFLVNGLIILSFMAAFLTAIIVVLVAVATKIVKASTKEGRVFDSDNVNSAFKNIGKVILAVAGVLVLVAVAMRMIAEVNWDNLNGLSLGLMLGLALILIGGIVAVVALITKNKAKMNQNTADSIGAVSKIVRSLGIMMILIGLFFRELWLVDWDHVGRGFMYILLAMGFILVVLLAVAEIAQNSTKSTMTHVASIIRSLGLLLVMVGLFFQMFIFVDVDHLNKGYKLIITAFAFIALILGEILVLTKFAVTKNIGKGTVVLLITTLTLMMIAIGWVFQSLASSIRSLSDSGFMMTTLETLKDIITQLIIMVGLIGTLAILGGKFDVSDDVIKIALTISAMLVAIGFIIQSLVNFVSAGISAEEMKDMTDSISALFGLIFKIINYVSLIMAVVGIIVGLVSFFGAIKGHVVATALVATIESIALIIVAISAFLKSIAALAKENVKGANGLTVLADSIVYFFDAIESHSKSVDYFVAKMKEMVWPLIAVGIAFVGIGVGVGVLSVALGILALILIGIVFLLGKLTNWSFDPEKFKKIVDDITACIDSVLEDQELMSRIQSWIDSIVNYLKTKVTELFDSILPDWMKGYDENGNFSLSETVKKGFNTAGNVAGGALALWGASKLVGIGTGIYGATHAGAAAAAGGGLMASISAGLMGVIASPVFPVFLAAVVAAIGTSAAMPYIGAAGEDNGASEQNAKDRMLRTEEAMESGIRTGMLGGLADPDRLAKMVVDSSLNDADRATASYILARSQENGWAFTSWTDAYIERFDYLEKYGTEAYDNLLSQGKELAEQAGKENADTYVNALTGELTQTSKVLDADTIHNLIAKSEEYEKAGNYDAAQYCKGLAAGLYDNELLVGDQATMIARMLHTSVEDELEIESPSKVMMRIGSYVDEGLAIGIQNGTANVIDSMSKLVDGTINATDDLHDAAEVSPSRRRVKGNAPSGHEYDDRYSAPAQQYDDRGVAINTQAASTASTTAAEQAPQETEWWQDIWNWITKKAGTGWTWLLEKGGQAWDKLQEWGSLGMDWLYENAPDIYNAIAGLRDLTGMATWSAWDLINGSERVQAVNVAKFGGEFMAGAGSLTNQAYNAMYYTEKADWERWAKENNITASYGSGSAEQIAAFKAATGRGSQDEQFNQMIKDYNKASVKYGFKNSFLGQFLSSFGIDTDELAEQMMNGASGGAGGSSAAAAAANKSFNSALDSTGSGTTESGVSEITFNQYNYSPEPIDRTELYQQTKRQLKMYNAYAGGL